MPIFGIDIKTLGVALLSGILPTFLWLRFWWREDECHREPKVMLVLTFVAGMISVMIALSLERVVADMLYNTTHIIVAAATIEEILKLIVVGIMAFSIRFINEPTDYALYLITGALGFAALENTLFLIEPLTHQDVTVTILTGNLRYLGSTVLHTVASATIGAFLGLAFYKSNFVKMVHGVIGILTAITLHTLFNFFIMKGTAESIVTVFAILWASAILLLVVFEKLKQLHRQHKLLNTNFYNHHV